MIDDDVVFFGNLTLARFPKRRNVFDDNVVLLHRKIPYESEHTLGFTNHAMLLK